MEKHDAYTRLAAPLLNRFEKQVLERNHLLNADHVFLVKRLRAFVQCLGADLVKADARDSTKAVAKSAIALAKSLGDQDAELVGLSELQHLFCGYHADSLSSLAQTVIPPQEQLLPGQMDVCFAEAVQRLLWVATPEAVCRSLKPSRIKNLVEDFGVDSGKVYFKDQVHTGALCISFISWFVLFDFCFIVIIFRCCPV